MVSFEIANPEILAIIILVSALTFTVCWFLDSLTHKKLVQVEITLKELQVHRNILISSLVMEFSLVLMFWFPIYSLPLFIASTITRFTQEFIDESSFHANRCSPYESYLHLGMWISVYCKASAMFIWGFFSQYKGLTELDPLFFVLGGFILLSMSYISIQEWKR